MNRPHTAVSTRMFFALSLAAISAVSFMPSLARAENTFVGSDTTVSGVVTDTNYLVGKDPGLNTLPGTVTLTVNGDVYPDYGNAILGPNGLMTGIHVFGTHQATVAGSTQNWFGLDNSVNTLSGGFAQNYVGLDNSTYTVNGGTSNNTYGGGTSTATLNSGQINSWQSGNNAKLNVAGGTVTTAVLNDTSTLNLSAGTVTNLQVNPGSVANVSGTGTIGTRTGSGNVNYNAVTVPSTFELSGATTSTLNNVAVQTLKVDQTATVAVNNAPVVPAVNLIEAKNQATVQANSGNLNVITAVDTAWLNINGASISSVSLSDTSKINVITGYVAAAQLSGSTTAVIQGGQVGSLEINGTALTPAQLTINGGLVSNVDIKGAVKAIIGGGEIDSLKIGGQSAVDLWGGTISPNTIRLFDEGTIAVFGTGLWLAPSGTGFDSFGSFTSYSLSGTLANGNVMNGINVLTYSTTMTVGDPTLGSANTGSVSFHVPEPTSVGLLGLGTLGLLLAARRRKKR